MRKWDVSGCRHNYHTLDWTVKWNRRRRRRRRKTLVSGRDRREWSVCSILLQSDAQVKSKTNEGNYIELLWPEGLCWLGEHLYFSQFYQLTRFIPSRVVWRREKRGERNVTRRIVYKHLRSYFSSLIKEELEFRRRTVGAQEEGLWTLWTSWGVKAGRNQQVFSDSWKPRWGRKVKRSPLSVKEPRIGNGDATLL